MNIGILPPDINESLSNFSVSDGNIRFGLSAIKGVGSNNITSIMKNRSNEGNFKSLHQFLDRMGSNINSKTIEVLFMPVLLTPLEEREVSIYRVTRKCMTDLIPEKNPTLRDR